jgi:hypothetical protein
MTLDLEFDDDDAAFASSVRRYCTEHQHPVAADGIDELHPVESWPTAMWRGLADLGVLAVGTPEGGGGATTVVAVMEQLGATNVPGPLAATFAAGQMLHEDDRKAVATGDVIVSLGVPPLMPWLPVAGVVIELSQHHAYLSAVDGPIDSVQTLGGEPWGRAMLRRLAQLEHVGHGLAFANAALAAYLAGAGAQLLAQTAEYARDRVQFRAPIGTFQAVAHPLAQCALRLSAARTLARRAADAIDHGDRHAAASAAAARLSAGRAALDVAHQAHQTYGALGFTIEGPVARVSSRIRQLTMLPPPLTAIRDTVLSAHGL